MCTHICYVMMMMIQQLPVVNISTIQQQPSYEKYSRGILRRPQKCLSLQLWSAAVLVVVVVILMQPPQKRVHGFCSTGNGGGIVRTTTTTTTFSGVVLLQHDHRNHHDHRLEITPASHRSQSSTKMRLPSSLSKDRPSKRIYTIFSTRSNIPTTELTMISTTDSSSSSSMIDDDGHIVPNDEHDHDTTTTLPTALFSIRQRILQQYKTIFSIITSSITLIYSTINHSILLQLVLLISLYVLHLTILSQHMAILCWNTIAIGYDSLIGCCICMIYYYCCNKQQRRRQREPLSSSSSFPWNLPRPRTPTDSSIASTPSSIIDNWTIARPNVNSHQHNTNINNDNNNNNNNNNSTISASSVQDNDTKLRNKVSRYISNWFSPTVQRPPAAKTSPIHNNDIVWIRFRISMILTCAALMKAYFQTGTYSLFWEDLLYSMSAAGWPLTIPLSRSIQVLAGHLTWVTAGSIILWAIPRPPPFFQQQPRITPAARTMIHPPNGEHNDNDSESAVATTTSYRWFRMSLRDCNWLWWTIGGYFVSSWLFNIADVLNRSILPIQVLQDATESVVTQLVQPEQNDIAASIIGYIAPCVTAPIWEELLYRGFLLAGLTTWTGSYHISCIVQAIIFSAHHMSITAALPLAVLGYTWAVLYTQSKNLWTVIAVHAMWNSRVFLGSWFGL